MSLNVANKLNQDFHNMLMWMLVDKEVYGAVEAQMYQSMHMDVLLIANPPQSH